MNILTTLSQFAVVGVLVGLVGEYTKNLLTKEGSLGRTLYILALSLVGGAVVYFFHLIPQAWLTDFVGVIAAVNTAYVFLVQYLPNNTTPAA